jgi:hypothetical protein
MEKMNNVKDNDFILFVYEESGFQTRIMLINAKEFLDIRGAWYELMNNMVENIDALITPGNQVITINVIKINMLKCNGIGGIKMENTPVNKVIATLGLYATGFDTDDTDDIDKKWYDSSYIIFNKGYDHIRNYIIYSKLQNYKGKPINIINSFLCIKNKTHDQYFGVE